MKIFFTTFLTMMLFASSCSSPDNFYYDGIYPNTSTDENGDKFTEYGENNFISTETTPISSFSVDADGASYSIMRGYVNSNIPVPSAAVRIEEYLNYFTFDYPEPLNDDKISVSAEITKAPWNNKNYLMRIGIKGKTIPTSQLPPSNYVFLIDVSGSMASEDKIELAKQGFSIMADNLRDDDRVTIITYSGSVSMALEPTLGKDKEQIKNVISKLTASGYTDGGNAIQMAYKTAKDYYVKGGNNRVILATDGDFNVGVTDNEALVEIIESYLDSGIYLTVLGFGRGNLNDSMMEQVVNHGNGNYEYIDNVKQIKKVFVDELNKLYPIAKDTKVQVSFTTDHVEKYRLIGYENRVMSEEEFEDTQKDAGEIGVGQTITALYEIIPKEGDSQEQFANIVVKYKEVDNDSNKEINLPIIVGHGAIQSATLSDNQKFAAAIAMYGLLLKDSEFKGDASKSLVIELAEEAITYDPNGYRSEFVNIVKEL